MNSSWRTYVTELIGTGTVVLLTSGAVCVAALPNLAAHPWGARYFVALMAGLSWSAALAFTVRISGGFLNPALTVALWVFHRLENRWAGGLIVAQLLGGALAGLALRGLFFASERVLLTARLGTPHLNRQALDIIDMDRTAVLIGIGIETVMSFVVTFAVFIFVYDPRFRRTAGEGIYRLGYLWLGIIVGLVTLLTFDLTGAGLNPARWFGTVLWESTVDSLIAQGPWRDHGPYWLGPLVGSLLAGAVASYAVLPPATPDGSPPRDLP
jgi:glycerol uptake facilitator-like aquaporin